MNRARYLPSIRNNAGWRGIGLGTMQVLGLLLAMVVVAGAVIIGLTVGGGLLAIWMFVPAAQNGATVGPSIADVFWFAIGALVGAGASVVVLVVLLSLLLGYFGSSSGDTMDGRDWGT